MKKAFWHDWSIYLTIGFGALHMLLKPEEMFGPTMLVFGMLLHIAAVIIEAREAIVTELRGERGSE